MKRWARAVEWFFGPQPLHALVAARIGFGLLLFFAYLNRLPDVQQLFGPQGVSGVDLFRRAPQLPRGRILESSFHLLQHVDSAGLIWLLYGALLVSSLAFALGAWTRTAGITTLVLHSLFQGRDYAAFSDWAVMIKPWLLFVVLAPVGRYASLDAWRRGTWTPALPVSGWLAPSWPLRLLQIHLCGMYALPGWSRIHDPVWLRGEMVFQILNDRWWGRFDVDWAPWAPVLHVLTWMVLVLEPLAPILLWVPRIGTLWCLGLIGMHLSMELLTNAGMWQPMMLTALLAFLPPSWVAHLLSPRITLGLVREVLSRRRDWRSLRSLGAGDE